MLVKDLVRLLQGLNQEMVVIVYEDRLPTRKEFEMDWGYTPKLSVHKQDEFADLLVIGPRKHRNEADTVVEIDHRGPSGIFKTTVRRAPSRS